MYSSLQVYLLDTFVGWLGFESERNEFSFRYDESYLKSQHPRALSFSLPLQSEPFAPEITSSFFANLLPPEVVRRKLGPCLHLSRYNIFGFLKAIGGDCAGAVALYMPGSKPPCAHEVYERELSDEEALNILHLLPKRPIYAAAETGYRYSAAGAQDKLVVRIHEGHIFLPLKGTPSSHIIKPMSADFEDTVYNEHFCQELAAQVGLSAAHSTLMRIKDEVFYVAERYDRTMQDGQIVRLHQEDFCQALGVDPESKYEEDGGPGIATCYDALRHMRAPIADQLAFLDAIIFNYLIGNADAHAKNFSVLYRDGQVGFAPLYDMVCTTIYEGLSKESAMRIGGTSAFAEINRSAFEQMATECHIAPALIQLRIDRLIASIVPAAERLEAQLYSEWPSPIYARILSEIKANASRLSL